MKKFHIYAWPAYATRRVNPYNYLIYKHIEDEGYPIHDFSIDHRENLLRILFSSRNNILHMHWPTTNVLKVNNIFGACTRLVTFYVFIKLVKLFGKKIIWTVHNLGDHENIYPFLHKYMDKVLYRHVDGFISMNRAGLELIKKQLKPNSIQKISYIPHPHYHGYYPNEVSRAEARKKLGLPEDAFVFLFLGQIRGYKNLPTLVKAFRELKERNTFLVIAGKVYRDVPLSELEDLTKHSDAIQFHNSFVEDSDIQHFLNACDLVVLPYKKIFNSGSVFLNLSFNRPTLAPDMNALSDLHKMLGERWIKTYKGELTASVLRSGMQQVKKETNIGHRPDIQAYNPEEVAKQTLNFYQSFM